MNPIKRRRTLLKGIGSFGPLLALSPNRILAAVGALPLTPSEPEGPFYPPESVWPAAISANLRGTGSTIARGIPLDVGGRVIDRGGRPLAGIQIDIWQTDGFGHYLHPDGVLAGAVSPRDPLFSGIGRALTGADGRFSFETIMPIGYQSRPPHIHARLTRENNQHLLTTQLYLPGQTDEEGLGSRLFSSIWAADRDLLTLSIDSQAASAAKGRFDFVVATS